MAKAESCTERAGDSRRNSSRVQSMQPTRRAHPNAVSISSVVLPMVNQPAGSCTIWLRDSGSV